jgi:hypothetical protein
MDLAAFRERVRKEFGEDLHRASPASVRDFVNALSQQSSSENSEKQEGRYVIEESARSYEEVMRTFLARVLDLPAEKAVPQLWTVALELSYVLIESQDADRLEALFRGLEEPPL